MTRWLMMAPIALALVVSTSSAAEAPVDLSTVLVGTCQGEVQMASGTYPRTLIIKSIRDADGRKVVDAEYGGAGNYGGRDPRVRPVPVTLEAFGKDVILRFYTLEAWSVELSLYKDQRHLLGDLRIPISRGAWGINPMKLTKVE